MSVLLKIRVDDQGNPALDKLKWNAKEAKKHVEPLGDTLKRVFSSAALLIGVDRIIDGFKSLGTEAAKFEQNMKRIQGIGNVTKGLDLMSKSVRDLAFSTEYSASQISSSMLDMVKAGFDDPAAVAKAMPNVINLATTAMMDLNYAAENTVDILRAFGLENEETARVANVMANSLNMTTMNAEDYFEAIKYVSSISKNMNVSLEETSALLGMLANAGIKGSQAGTSLRSILLNLMQPNKAVTAGLKSMNLEGKSLVDILIGLKEKGLTVIDFLKTFDKTAITSTMTLANTSPKFREAYDKITEALRTQALSVKSTSDIVRTNYIDTLKQLKNMLGVITIEFLDTFGEGTRKAIESVKVKLTEAREWVNRNQDDIKRLATTVTDLVGAFINLSGSAISMVVKNFEMLINMTGALIGIKGLLGLSNILKTVNTSFLTFTPTWTTSLGSLATSFNVAAVAAAGLYMYMNYIVDLENKKTDKRIANATDYSEEGLNKQIEAFQLVRLRLEEYENAKTKFKSVEGKYDYESQQRYLPYKIDMNSAEERLLASRQNIANIGYNWNVVNGENIDAKIVGEIKNLEAHINLVRKKKLELKTEGEKKPEKSLTDLISDMMGGTKGKTKATKVSNDLFDYLGTSWKEQKALMDDLKSSGSLSQSRQASIFHPALPYAYNNSDFINQGVKDSELSGSLPNVGIEAKDISKVSTQAGIDRKLDLSSKGAERIGEAVKSINDSMWSLGQTTSDVMSTLVDKRLEKTLASLETEKAAIQNRYDTEINAAGISAFKKEQLEQEKTQKLIALDQKMVVEKEKAARKQKAIDTAVATAKAAQAVIGVLAETTGGPIVRTAAALEIAAIAGTYLATMMAINLRSGGYVSGSGNGTSDSVPANLSKGEYVVSSSDVSKAGGPRGIQTAIDRSVGYSSSKGSTIMVGTIIGEETYVREYLIPLIRKEQRR